MNTTPLRIAIVQAKFKTADFTFNCQKIVELTQRAQHAGAQLLLLPEYSFCGVGLDALAERKDFLSRQAAAMQALAQQLTAYADIGVIVGHVGEVQGRLTSCLSLLQAGEIRQLSCSAAVGADPLAAIVDVAEHRFAILQSEAFNSSAILQDYAEADVQSLLVADATPYHQGRMAAYQKVLLDSLRDFKFNLFYTNHVGGHDELIYEGRAFHMNAEAELQSELDHFVEAMAIYQVDDQAQWHVQQLIPLADETLQEEDLYYQPTEAVESEIWRALVMSTRDFFQASGINKAMLGLSGGMDSALVLAVLYDALGAENITAVMLSSPYTSQLSHDLAEDMANRLGVSYHDISIEPMYQAFLDGLAPLFEGRAPDTTEENLQARVRGVILMALSNKLGGMVVCSTNKSEQAVGYSTLYGDTVGGFAILKDLTKTQVYRLAHWRNSQSAIIPERIITRAPSAELAEGQVDQDSLPDYDILDEILYRLMELKQSSADIVAAGFAEDVVEKIARLLKNNEYKRRQIPPGPRLSEGAFGLDWRYPIAHGYRF